MTPEQKQMAETARDIFKRDNVAAIVKGGEAEMESAITLLVNVYPEAKRNRGDAPYTFEDFVNETSAMLTGSIVVGALTNTGRTATFMSAKP